MDDASVMYAALLALTRQNVTVTEKGTGAVIGAFAARFTPVQMPPVIVADYEED